MNSQVSQMKIIPRSRVVNKMNKMNKMNKAMYINNHGNEDKGNAGNKVNKKIVILLSVVTFLIFAIQAVPVEGYVEDTFLYPETRKVQAHHDFFELLNLCERQDGQYYTVVDQQGNVIMRTARHLHKGDQYICGENRHYEIYEVVEDTAYAREVEESVSLLSSASMASMEQIQISLDGEGNDGEAKRIGILHSHGAESYVPSDGDESIEEGGGVLQVGDSFREALEEKGITVIHSKETHVPHDSGAYNRARRTKEEIMKDEPDAIFDVHRDAVPGEDYLEEIEGEERVQVLLVVGRQNQNFENNKEFAEGLKQAADEEHPNLVKGILMAEGNYNQDMSGRSLLLEVGSHENSREDAQESIALFADAANSFIYGGPAPGGVPGEGGTAAGRAIGLIALVILAAAAYLLISTGSIEELKAKVKQFTQKEFTNFLGSFSTGGKNSFQEADSGDQDSNDSNDSNECHDFCSEDEDNREN